MKNNNYEKHGMTNTRFYKVWGNLLQRCTNKNLPTYPHYGGRGIKVCEEWYNFTNFKNDLYESYLKHVQEHGEKNTTIDRINVHGDYELNNCRWATRAVQKDNTRDTIYVEYDGKIKSVKQWSKELGINFGTLRSRFYREKLSPEIAFLDKVPRKNDRIIKYKNQEKSLTQWSKYLGISIQLLSWRLNHWPLERIFRGQ